MEYEKNSGLSVGTKIGIGFFVCVCTYDRSLVWRCF